MQDILRQVAAPLSVLDAMALTLQWGVLFPTTPNTCRRRGGRLEPSRVSADDARSVRGARASRCVRGGEPGRAAGRAENRRGEGRAAGGAAGVRELGNRGGGGSGAAALLGDGVQRGGDRGRGGEGEGEAGGGGRGGDGGGRLRDRGEHRE